MSGLRMTSTISERRLASRHSAGPEISSQSSWPRNGHIMMPSRTLTASGAMPVTPHGTTRAIVASPSYLVSRLATDFAGSPPVTPPPVLPCPLVARPEDDTDDRRREVRSCLGASHQAHHRDSAAMTVTAARSAPATRCVTAQAAAGRGRSCGPGETVSDDPASHAWWPYAQEFPRWHVWRGISGLAYARLSRSSPPIVVRAEGATELRNEIRRAEAALSIPAVQTGR